MSSNRNSLIYGTIDAVMLLAQCVKGTPAYQKAEADIVRLGEEFLKDDGEIAEPYTLDDALRYARLWRAGKLIGGDSDSVIFALLAEIERSQSSGGADAEIGRLRAGLKFYADGDHMLLGDPDAWDTVTGEPQNWYCDEEGTATIEDGTIAKQVLAGYDLKWDAQGELTLAPADSQSSGEAKSSPPKGDEHA